MAIRIRIRRAKKEAEFSTNEAFSRGIDTGTGTYRVNVLKAND
jgi:hypothetical protein